MLHKILLLQYESLRPYESLFWNPYVGLYRTRGIHAGIRGSSTQEPPETNGAPDNNNNDDNDNTREEQEEHHNQEHAENETNGDNANGAETVNGETVTETQAEPKTITSMYGKVYTLKK